jgi:preprotein translocase subunit SecY
MSFFSGLANIGKVPDLRKRLLFTLGMLAVYRIGVFVTIPGVDRNVLRAAVGKGGGGLLGMLNMFSGGAVGNASIFFLGIMPYISASIVLQLLTMLWPPLSELRKEGEAGTRKINQYTRYLTILIALFQGLKGASMLQGMSNADLGGSNLGEVVAHPGPVFLFISTLSFMTGTAFVMWVGEQITERGVGNGTSLIIFAGIVDGIPAAVINYFRTNQGNIQPLNLAAVLGIILACVAVIVFFETGQRRIPIFYARRTIGRRVFGEQKSHLPLKVNTSGTIPPIFAMSMLGLPGMLAGWKIPLMGDLQQSLNRGDWMFNVFYVGLIVFFCFFYTAVTFPAVDLADNLKKQQAFIPHVRAGKQTADYIDKVLTRITLGGAAYVAAVCIIPSVVGQWFHIPFQFGGTSIMIVVGVALELVRQIETYLLQRNYDGLSGGGGRGAAIRGRRDV